ncbi:MAG: efflux RND transporter periplasmic adaptor subunit [Phycisphaerae bacterium]|nr:efflux RND transporter periplasmic adaptor subunit [Phycisphaerae bacterium]
MPDKKKTRSRTKRYLLALFLLTAGSAVVGWWSLRSESERPDNPTTAQVVRRDFALTVLATGAVRPQVGAEVKVGARISGRVERLHVDIGDTVKKGQELATLEKEELQAQVALCQAELSEAEARLTAIRTERPEEIARAEAALAESQAALELAEINSRRLEDLRKKDVVHYLELDTARKELDTAKSRVKLAKAELALARMRMPDDIRVAEAQLAAKRAKLAEANARLSYATIRAPISGTVASVTTQEGETVAAGLNSPTFVTIIDLGRLQVDAFVDEVDIGKVKVEQKALFVVDAFPDREFEGRVSAIYPEAVIQDNVVNYDVVVDITSPYENLLRPEMTTNVTIFLEARRGVLAVPSKAIQRQRGANIVHVQTANGPEPRKVKVGWRENQWVEVLDGLSEGQTVYLEPPTRTEQPESQS